MIEIPSENKSTVVTDPTNFTVMGYTVDFPRIPFPFELEEAFRFFPEAFDKKYCRKGIFTSSDRQKLTTELLRELIQNVEGCFDDLLECLWLSGFRRPDKGDESLEGRKYRKKLYEIRHLGITRIINLCVKESYSSWIDYFKYKLASFYAFHQQQILPKCPEFITDDNPGIIINGCVHFWIKRLKARGGIHWFQFMETILMGVKRGMPRAPCWLLEQEEKKLFNKLTTEAEQIEQCSFKIRGMERNCDVDTLKNEISRTVSEIFKNEVMTLEDWEKPFVASFSSNYNNTRGELGAVGWIKDWIEYRILFQTKKLDDYMEVVTDYTGPDEVNINKFRQEQIQNNDEFYLLRIPKEGFIDIKYKEFLVSDPINNNYNIEKRNIFELMKELDPNLFKYNETMVEGVEANLELFNKTWKLFYWDLFIFARDHEDPYVQAVALAESMKIRCISKGPPGLYTVLKPMQAFLWRVLKQHEVFRLIGNPISEEDFELTIGELELDKEIISGDYKASTDNLHSWASETAATTLLQVLRENGSFIPEGVDEMLIRSLTKHKFIDIEKYKKLKKSTKHNKKRKDNINIDLDIESCTKEQKTGQLMGSITSFPFLCIANATLCRFVLETCDNTRYNVIDKKTYNKNYKKDKNLGIRYRYNYNKISLRINGDDCLFKGQRQITNEDFAQDSLYDVWSKIGAMFGLSCSVGKTYVTDNWSLNLFAVMNSYTCYYLNGKWTNIKYIAYGLVKGKARTGDREYISYQDLGILHHELHKVTPTELWSQVSNKFINHHKHILQICPNIPWEMPSWLGGAGLVRKNEISHRDLKIASFLISCLSKKSSYNREFPIRSKSNVQRIMVDHFIKRNLDIDKIGFTRIRDPSTYPDLFEEIDFDMKYMSDKLYGSIAVSLMINPSISVSNFAVECPLFDAGEVNKKEDSTINRMNNKSWMEADRFVDSIKDLRIIDSAQLFNYKVHENFPVMII